jgi:hypothetical protein
MSGNTTTSSNFTGLYGAAGGTVVPTTPYGNANVVSLLAAGSDGANTVGNISATGNITANYYSGNGSLLTGVVATGVGTLTSLSVTGNTQSGNLLTAGVVSATGNVTGAFLLGNGSQLTGIVSSYGNANVVANLAALGSNPVSTTGNISGGYFLGNGSQLTGLPATYSNANVVGLMAAFGSNTISTTGNITSGNINTPDRISATGNISTGGFFIGTFLGNIVGNLIVPGANTQVLYNNNGNADASSGLTFNSASNLLTVGGAISSAGNITGVNILGNGSGLTSITGANVTGTVANATFATSAGTATTAVTANTVTDPAQANITSVGVLTSLSSSGNITGANINGNGSGLSSITGANVTGTVANATFATSAGTATTATTAGTVTTAAQANITSVGTLTSLSVSGTTQSGNLFTAGAVSATGNITGGNLTITTDAVIQGNLTVNGTTTTVNSNTVTINDKFINVANNAATAAAANGGGLGVGPVGSEYAALTYNSTSNAWNTSIPVSVTGNVAADYYIGNGSQLTGVVATGVGTLTSLSVTGNVDAGNLRTAGQVSATGNITGANINGNGSGLSSITGGNVTGTVANATFATSAASATTAGTVTTAAQANITSVGTLTSLSVSGNVTAGNVATTVVSATSSAGLSLKNASGTTQASMGAGGGDNFAISVSTNITGANAQIDISPTGNSGHVHIKPTGTPSVEIAPTYTGSINNMIIGNATPAAINATTASASGNVTGGNIVTAGVVSAAGNISANYYIGNGSLLTGISSGSTYGNANVSNFLATGFGSNTISTTGNISAGNAALTGNLSFGSVDVRNYNNRLYTLDAQFNALTVDTTISATGNVTGGNILTGGVVSATGNVTGGNILTGGVVNATGNVTANNFSAGNSLFLASTVEVRNYNNRLYSTDAEFNTLLVGTTISALGNITGGNILTTGQMSATGNVTGNYFVGNGSQLTGLAASYGNANVSNFLANGFGSNTIVTTGNITANNMSVGNNITLGGTVTIRNFNNRFYTGDTQVDANLTVTGGANTVTITGSTGNITTPGIVSAVGNVTGNYFIGNGSQLTGIAGGGSPGGSNTQLQFNNAGAFAGNAAATFDIVTGNLVIRNTTFNTANAIVSTAVFDDTVVSASVVNPGRILIGTGPQGNNTWTTGTDTNGYGRGSAVLISNRFVKAANGRRASGFTVDTVVTPAANISTGGTRLRGSSQTLRVGGGASSFNWTNSTGFQAPMGLLGSVDTGNDGVTQAGNTVVTTATAVAGSLYANPGSTITNGFGVIGDVEGNVVNSTAFAVSFYNESAAPANVYGYWMGGNSSTGYNTDNGARNATNYYFLRNDDPVAQAQLGSLRTFHEYRYDTAAVAGALTINKLNAQVQYVPVTAAITSITFSNFVVSAATNTQTKYQTDTVTVLFRQDSTGYAITLPTGSAYLYAGGINVMGTTANAVQMLSVTAIYDSVTAATQYLITVSPEFV